MKKFIFLAAFCALLNAAEITPQCQRDDAKDVVVCSDKKLGNLMWQDGAKIAEATFEQAKDYCENLNFAGYAGWRLPNKAEILSIADKSRYEPAIKREFKYIAGVGASYWSGDKFEGDKNRAWIVVFKRGGDNWSELNKLNFVRCVRDAQISQASQNTPSNNNSANLHNDSKVETPSLAKSEAAPAARVKPPSNEAMYRDDSKSVVIDSVYKLIWEDGAEIFEGNWDKAKRYCENLNFAGYSDWRLPTRLELLSITDDSRHNPAINSAFKNIVSDFYWSSTKSADNSSYARHVSFGYGNDGRLSVSWSLFVRCVREYK